MRWENSVSHSISDSADGDVPKISLGRMMVLCHASSSTEFMVIEMATVSPTHAITVVVSTSPTAQLGGSLAGFVH